MKFNLQLFNEELPQIDLVQEDYILPDDYVEEETTEEDAEPIDEEAEETLESEQEELDTEEESESGAEEETNETNEEDTTESLGDLEVKFLGETKKLSDIPKEELQKLVQTGMNQERFHEKYETLKETEQDLTDTAELFGMDVKEMLTQLREQHFKNIADQDNRNINDVRNEYNSKRQQREDKMYRNFVDKYPDVNPNDLPIEVKMDIQDGLDPTKSYEKYLNATEKAEKDSEINTLKAEIETLKKQMQTKEQNSTTKKKGVVKKTTDSGTDNQDDFLAGLLGD